MTESQENILLRNVLLDAAMAEYAAELADRRPEPESPRLRRQMAAMLNDPDGWAKRRRRPLWAKLARAAAMFLLVCVLSLGALMAVSPPLRAAVVNWAVEWYESHIVYRFSGAQPEDPLALLPKYELTAVPEGYAFDREMAVPGAYDILFVNDEGDLLWFGYQRMTQGSLLGIETENTIVSEITVNGCPGQLYHSLDPEECSAVVWVDAEENLFFSLSGYFNDLELLHMAESVVLVNLTK